MIFGKQVSHACPYDVAWLHLQDTHVPRAGRDVIRKELEDASVIVSVSSSLTIGEHGC